MKKSFTKIVPDFWQERSQFFLISEMSQKSSQSSYFEGCSDFYANTYIQVKEEINNSHIYKIIIEYLFEKTRIYTFNKNIIRSFQQYNTGQKIFVMNKIKINKCLKKNRSKNMKMALSYDQLFLRMRVQFFFQVWASDFRSPNDRKAAFIIRSTMTGNYIPSPLQLPYPPDSCSLSG